MNEREKLKHLVGHWKGHNTEHAATYRAWATRIEHDGPVEARELLHQIADKTEELDPYFDALIHVLS